LLDSIRRLLERYGPDAVVYPGHGGPTTLGRELESNPFLAELRAGS
jgi:glyoxylase-like metal-dependent hydrolase (beta-lactamase superfamily II)